MDKTNFKELFSSSNLGEAWEIKRQKITDSLDVQVEKCSWCGKSTATSKFTSFSLNGNACMCFQCLNRYAVLCRIVKLHELFKHPENWDEFEREVENEVFPQVQETISRMEVVKVIMQLARRTSAIIGGAKVKGDAFDTKTGVQLTPIRINVASWSDLQIAALKRGLEFCGMPMVSCSKEEIMNGIAKCRLENETMRDSMTFEYGVLFVRDGAVQSDLECSMIFLFEGGK